MTSKDGDSISCHRLRFAIKECNLACPIHRFRFILRRILKDKPQNKGLTVNHVAIANHQSEKRKIEAIQ
ncbi:glutamate--cysteine ligase [Shewanella sp. HN-41]|nr:glutamate--cysteine ligase [Shewanella sp. HN-41]